MYVNERTLDYGKDGREAIVKLLDMGYDAGIITEKPKSSSWATLRLPQPS